MRKPLPLPVLFKHVRIHACAVRLAGTAALAGLLFAMPVALPAQKALAQGKIVASHGAWNMVCDTPPGASSEQCALMQNVVAEDRPEVGLSVVVLRTADRKSEILRVLAPLGVLLPNGLGLNIDGQDIGRAYFVRCFQDGCYAEVILDEKLVGTLKSGKIATFIVFQTPEEGIGIPVDLSGFAEGYAKIP
ncbi:MAG: invasion associated locus B family protein [Nitratireductor sp.]|nr:invasion associated locus B family protein [Nitratireductor sp.]